MSTVVAEPKRHGHARVEKVAGPQPSLQVETDDATWSYAVSFELSASQSLDGAGEPRAIIDLEVKAGVFCIGCTTANYSSYVDREVSVPSGMRRKVYVPIGAPGAASHLMFRNVSRDGRSLARIHGIEIRRAAAAEEIQEHLRCSGPIGLAVPHGGTVVQTLGARVSLPDFQPILIETDEQEYSYAATFGLTMPLELGGAGEPRAVVDLEVEAGEVSIGCMTADYSSYADDEVSVPTGMRRKVYVPIGAPGAASQLMLRNASPGGRSTARIYGIKIRRATDAEEIAEHLRSLGAIGVAVPHVGNNNVVVGADTLPPHKFDALFGDLDELGQATVKFATLPFLFCVVSWGCAATQWLADTLNSHPDIYCAHCENLFWERLGGARSLNGWQYLRILGRSSDASRACGDVHGVSMETIPDLRAKLGENFNCAILVREPLARLRSQMALFEIAPIKTIWNVDYVQQFIDRGVRLPEDNIVNRLFLHGVSMLNRILQEERMAPVWRSEDLTANAAMLTRFIEELTRGHVQIEPEWAERVIRRPPNNRHRGSNTPKREFAPWQIEAIKKIVEPRSWRSYARLGYQTPDFIALTVAG